MSRQSDNSKAGSEENGDSLLSSYQNSPRKTTEFGSAGPFGDYCADNKPPNYLLFMMDDDSSPESEDQQTTDLKVEYLERLNLIRQKLANIDIANYESYYNKLCDYPSSYSPRCEITEIFNESPEDPENGGDATKCMDLKLVDNEATVSTKDKIPHFSSKNTLQNEERKKKSPYTERRINERIDLTTYLLDNTIEKADVRLHSNADSKNASPVKTVLPVKEANITDLPIKNVPTNYELESKNQIENRLQVEDKNIDNLLHRNFKNNQNIITAENLTPPIEKQIIESSRTEHAANVEKIKNIELKTIFTYNCPYDVESSVELIDLNYNPPKKKYCVREKTPKLIMSDGAMSLPYHVRVSLHSGTLNAKNQEPIDVDELMDAAGKAKVNTEDLERVASQNNYLTEEEENGHIFPEVQVDCVGGCDEQQVSDRCSEVLHKLTKTQVPESPIKSAGTESEYNVFFFEALTQSPSDSFRSRKTILTETTVTDSPSRKPKRRRLVLRSAQNKVKPVGTISLWEEIRTIDALKQQYKDSSSSLESYFKDVIIYRERPEPHVDMVSVGSLDIPSTTRPPSRFPSITRITKFCSSIFRKKSQTIIEESADGKEQLKETLNSKEKPQRKNNIRVTTPKAAYTLQNIRKEQDLDVELDRLTLSDENFSEYSSADSKDDSYYEGCPICFCF